MINNEECKHLSHYIHEIGHNLGLNHSGKNGVSLSDKSDYMGYSYDSVRWPLMCFNAAKNWQLGWYKDKTIELINISNCGPWKGRLYGYVDYPSVEEDGYVIIKVNDIYIQFNKIKEDINKDMIEDANLMVFTNSTSGFGPQSWSLGSLNETGSTWEYGDLLRVDLCGYNTKKLSDSEIDLEYLDIVIRAPDQKSICNQEGEDDLSNDKCAIKTSLLSDSPSVLPTNAPSMKPSMTSSVSPSSSPSKTPSISPTRTPSGVPSNETSDGPSSSQSTTPTKLPSMMLSIAPSTIPSNHPSTNPSFSPTAIQSSQPTNDPSNVPEPSTKPSLEPSVKPSQGLSLEPSVKPSLELPLENLAKPALELSLKPSLKPSPEPSVKISLEPSLKPRWRHIYNHFWNHL